MRGTGIAPAVAPALRTGIVTAATRLARARFRGRANFHSLVALGSSASALTAVVTAITVRGTVAVSILFAVAIITLVATVKWLIYLFFQHIAITGRIKCLFAFIRIKQRGPVTVAASAATVVLLATRRPRLLRTRFCTTLSLTALV